jgi:hypothetical protein
MDKLQPTGQNLARVFNFRSGHLHAAHLWCFQVKVSNLKLKTQPKQLPGSPLLDIALPGKSFGNTLYQNAFGFLPIWLKVSWPLIYWISLRLL